MNLPSHWLPDQYGILNLNFTCNGRDTHVWLRARQPYCDRGHWDWGNMGVGYSPLQPSHYFHHLHIAAAEIESFLRRVEGERVVDQSMEAPGAATHPNAEPDWAWESAPEGGFVLKAPSPEGEASLHITPIDDLGERTWRVNASGISSLDDADLFPRHYIHLKHAVVESEAFLAWRLHQRPAEHPGRLDEPLATQAPPAPKRPRP